MRIEKFEEIKAWQVARKLTQKVYHLTKKPGFLSDYRLKNQMRNAAGFLIHTIAEGLDPESNAEFMRFLRYAKRSCAEVQSQIYAAVDEKYISPEAFQET
jgi:four helix bundle protein